MSPIILPKRKCGTPQKGGLYAVSKQSGSGGLRLLTHIAAPLPAEIGNPRAMEMIQIAATLGGEAGLKHPDPYWNTMPPFGGLPRIGLADLWGAVYYRFPYDVIQEIKYKGVCRRIPHCPNIPTPIPYLVMHKDAVISTKMCWGGISQLLHDEYKLSWTSEQDGTWMEDQPWRDCHDASIGRVGDPKFNWHPYVKFYRVMWNIAGRVDSETPSLAQFIEQTGLRTEQGILGLGWLTHIAYTLKDDEETVPEGLMRKGVIPALVEGDPRIGEQQNDSP